MRDSADQRKNEDAAPPVILWWIFCCSATGVERPSQLLCVGPSRFP